MLLHSRIFWAQFLLMILIAAVQVTALTYDLYWRYVWSDLPVHFLGGVWVAFAILWLFSITGLNRKGVISVLFGVLCVGVGWELLELWGGVSFFEPNYPFDSSLDLLMDVLGGLFGYMAARRFLLPRV